METILKAQQYVPKNIFIKTFYSETFSNIYTSSTLYKSLCTYHLVLTIMNRWPILFHLYFQLLLSPTMRLS